MAKTRNPLFSLTATGTLAGCMEFRQQAGRQTVQLHGKPTGPATPPQTTSRTAWAAAATTWRTLDAPLKSRWTDTATALGIPPFALFAREWRLQQIEAPDLPNLPAPIW